MSPIKGLTGDGDVGFPSLGKLRKGAKKTEENRPGKDLDNYFRFTSDVPGVTEAFYEAYGPEPNELTFFLPYPDLARNWDSAKEKWLGGGTLHHRCDGEMCSRWLDEKTGEYLTAGKDGVEAIPCLGDCKEVGRLEIILPSLVEAGFVGTVTVESHSINDIVAIDKALRAGEMLIIGWGWRISQVPWFLYRSTKTIGRPRTAAERKKLKSVRGTTDKSLLFVAPDSEWMATQVRAIQEHARTASLPAPDMQTEPNERMAREEAMRPPPRESVLFREDDEETVTVDPATGEIADDEPDPWNEVEEEIPEIGNKAEFWEWAQNRFPETDRDVLADVSGEVTKKHGAYEDAAAELVERLG